MSYYCEGEIDKGLLKLIWKFKLIPSKDITFQVIDID